MTRLELEQRKQHILCHARIAKIELVQRMGMFKPEVFNTISLALDSMIFFAELGELHRCKRELANLCKGLSLDDLLK